MTKQFNNTEEELAYLKDRLKKLHGSNVIIVNEKHEILVGKSSYKEKKWMLPGGQVERGESYKHAAVTEAEEETGVFIEEENLSLIAVFLQKIQGFPETHGTLHLYECKVFEGIPNISEEFTDVAFMSIEEIIKRRDEFYLGYTRMIVHYGKFIKGLRPVIIETKLSEPVDFYDSTGKEITI